MELTGSSSFPVGEVGAWILELYDLDLLTGGLGKGNCAK